MQVKASVGIKFNELGWLNLNPTLSATWRLQDIRWNPESPWTWTGWGLFCVLCRPMKTGNTPRKPFGQLARTCNVMRRIEKNEKRPATIRRSKRAVRKKAPERAATLMHDILFLSHPSAPKKDKVVLCNVKSGSRG